MVSCPRDSAGRKALLHSGGSMVNRMHLLRAHQSEAAVSWRLGEGAIASLSPSYLWALCCCFCNHEARATDTLLSYHSCRACSDKACKQST